MSYDASLLPRQHHRNGIERQLDVVMQPKRKGRCTITIIIIGGRGGGSHDDIRQHQQLRAARGSGTPAHLGGKSQTAVKGPYHSQHLRKVSGIRGEMVAECTAPILRSGSVSIASVDRNSGGCRYRSSSSSSSLHITDTDTDMTMAMANGQVELFANDGDGMCGAPTQWVAPPVERHRDGGQSEH